jgi:hypothetical protein
MRLSRTWRIGILVTALCLCAQGQNPPSKEAPATESKGIPPRATPGDYQAHAAAGTVTVAAEFVGHTFATQEGLTFNTDDNVAVEIGLFGPAGARLNISVDNFSIRINAKKKKETSLPGQPLGAIFRSLKDPEWEAAQEVKAKEAKGSSTGISTGGQGGQSEPVAPVHMPLDLRRAMEQRVQKTGLLEGDRALPQAGLVFFLYRGKVQNIHSIELIYAGPAGTATLELQP